MIPLVVMVDDVLPKRMTERLLAEQDELRETFLFDGLHPALHERVQIRAPCRQLDGRDANRPDGPVERLAKLRVPVVNEVSARGQKADICHGHVASPSCPKIQTSS